MSTCLCTCLCLDNLTSLELPCHNSVPNSGSFGEHSLFFPFVSHSSPLTTNQNQAEDLHVLFVMRPDCTDLININTVSSPRLSKWWKHTRRCIIKCLRPLPFRICRGRSLKQSSIGATLELCPPKYLRVRRMPNDGTDWLKLKVTNSRQLLLLLHRKYYFYLWSLGTDFFYQLATIIFWIGALRLSFLNILIHLSRKDPTGFKAENMVISVRKKQKASYCSTSNLSLSPKCPFASLSPITWHVTFTSLVKIQMQHEEGSKEKQILSGDRLGLSHILAVFT